MGEREGGGGSILNALNLKKGGVNNILNLSESAFNLLKKSELVQKILDLKGKVVIDADMHKLCENIERLTETMNQIVAENKKLQSDRAIVRNVNCKLEDEIVYLKKIRQSGSNIATETR